MLPLARAAFAIALLAAATAHATSASEPARPPPGLTEMQMARLLVKAGRLEHARAFLEQARPSNVEERIARLFLLGRIEMRLGMPRRAAERFEAILALRPSLTRVRLELARAYYLSGREDEAGHQFSLSLADDLPPSAEAAVEHFLRRIDARKRWSASLSASLLPETKRTDREEVLIGGVPFRLDEEARSSSGTGGLIAAGISYSPTMAGNIRGVLAASAVAKVYERSEWNDVSVSGDAGLVRLFDRGSASGGLRLGRRWTGGDGHLRSLGPWTQFRLRLSDVTQLDLALSAGYRKHDTLHGRNGWRVAVNPRVLYVLDGRTTVEAEPAFEIVEAKKDHHGSRLFGLGVTVSRAFGNGLALSLTPAAHIRRHAAENPLFGRTRVDKTLNISARVLHGAWRYRGFAPYIGYSFERTRSSIPIHEHRNYGVIAGVSRVF